MSGSELPYGYELQFRLLFAEFRGNQFQDFFNRLMERRDPDFRRVRPWGSVGDRGNDGWSPRQRMLFQVYAPSSYRASELATKLRQDYDSAIGYWVEHFDTWVFVHNDVDGLSPEVERMVARLDGLSGDVTCMSWGREQIRQEVAQLSQDEIRAVLGPPILSTDFLDVNAASLQPLFDHLELSIITADTNKIGPVPVDKISRNRLGDAQSRLLTLGEAKMPLVDEYLSRTSALPTYKAQVAATFREHYIDLRDKGYNSDRIFDDLLSWLTADIAKSTSIINAVTVLAYFFFTCQIFEEDGL